MCIRDRRGTMAAADRLYGITMQEKGVSTLVSVKMCIRDRVIVMLLSHGVANLRGD